MEPRRRLVKDVEGSAGCSLLQFTCQLDPLCFAAGECWRRLPESYITKPDIYQGAEMPSDSG